MRKDALSYLAAAALTAACAAWVLRAGAALPPGAAPAARAASAAAGASGSALAQLLAQILVVTAAARGAGRLARGLRQPAVVGEIAAGLALGPSLLGRAWPGLHAALFPAGSLGTLHLISQVGIVIFMFLVGLELDLPALRARARAAVVVSHASIAFPFLLGMGLALRLYGRYAPAGVSFSSFALFMGIAMSVTAFPVLARILSERGLSGTPLGSAALACAAVDDATAWCLLAAVTAVAGAGTAWAAARTLACTAAFAAFLLSVVGPRLARARGGRAELGEAEFFAALLLLFASALCTELIGVHALFGAFLAGTVVPRDPALRRALRERLEGVSAHLLVPLFFAFTGLRTRLDGLGSDALTAFLLIMSAAVVGKVAGSALAARGTGMGWQDSLSLGALMNTRGLMELVVLNVGYDMGILSGPIFALLVLMALLTTLMTGPALDLLAGAEPLAAAVEPG